jgi:hypothetical protein
MNRADGLAEVFEHIARRLAISPEEAAERCRKVTSDLLAALDVAGHASIPGLGRFSRTQTVLRFEPEPRLAAVVNHRYADLHPISVDRDSEDSLGLGSASAVPEAPVAHELIENSSDSASTVDLASTADSEKSADTTDTTLDSLSGDNVGLATDAPTDEDTYGGGTSSIKLSIWLGRR